MNEIHELAIIGGGITGLYSASRVLESAEYAGASVAIIEREREVGGRIATAEHRDRKTLIADLAAMRILRSQPLVRDTIRRFGLAADLEASDHGPTIWRARRSWVTAGMQGAPSLQICDGNLVSNGRFDQFSLDKQEIGLSPAFLALLGFSRALARLEFPQATSSDLTSKCRRLGGQPLSALASFTPTEWRTIAAESRLDGVALWRYSLRGVLERHLSTEAFLLIQSLIGYQSFTGFWNAAEGMPWFIQEFSLDSPYEKLMGGMQRLPATIAAAHEVSGHSPGGCSFLCDREATKLTCCDGYYKIACKDIETEGDSQSVHARRILLAMPIDWMKRLSLDETFGDARRYFDDTVRELDNGLVRHSAVKLFIWCRKTWWTDTLAAVKWRLFSDGPIRQCYFESSDDDLNEDAPSLLMVYVDSDYARHLSDMSEVHGDTDSSSAPEIKLPMRSSCRQIHAHSLAWLIRSLEQLVPSAARITDHFDAAVIGAWLAPTKASWHCWRAGSKPWELRDRGLSPLGTEHAIHYASESIGVDQAWLEGGLRSAERALRLGFGIDTPCSNELQASLQAMGFRDLDEYIGY
ncbi:MAG: FAD-dependent oxidoreductase [Planctomycetota bacterium]